MLTPCILDILSKFQDDTEDMWHSYNLVSVGDSVRASTFRKVTTEGSTGSRQSTKIRLTLTITVEDIDFDTQACKLRVKGRNIEENEHVKLGAYHTIDIEPNRKFTLAKAEWDTVSLERIEMATDPSKSADVAAVVMQEGLANLVLISGKPWFLAASPNDCFDVVVLLRFDPSSHLGRVFL